MDVQRPIEVDNEQIEAIALIHKRNPTVSSVLNTFFNLATKGSFELDGVADKKVYDFKKFIADGEEFIEQEIFPVFREILLHYLLYGIAVVRAVPSQHFEGQLTLVVLPFNQIKILVSYNVYQQQEIRVYAIAGGVDNQDEIPNSYVSCYARPDHRGKLQSPIALLLSRLAVAEKMWQYQVEAAYRRLHPLHLFTQDTNGTKAMSRAGLETPRTSQQILATEGMGTTGTTAARLNAEAIAEQQANTSIGKFWKQIERSAHLGKERAKARDTQQDVFGMSSQYRRDIFKAPPEIARIEEMPTLPEFPLFAPPGTTLERTPEIFPPDQFIEIQERVEHDVYRSLGFLPPGSSGSSKFADNIAYINETLNGVMAAFIKATQPELSACVSLVLSASLVDVVFKERVIDSLESSVSNLPIDATTKEVLRAAMNNKPIEVYSDASVAVNVEDQLPIRTPKIIVRVTYGYYPSIDFDTALALRDSHAISQEAFQSITLKMTGLPDSMREKRPLEYFWQKEDVTTTAPGGAAAGGKKKKAKPAISAKKKKTK